MKYCRDGHLKTNKRCLLCSPDEQTSLEATTSLIIFLYEHGCKITKEKTHVAESKVIFLGHCISQGTKHLTEERKQAISKVSEPRTEKRVRAFLGLVGYCREWIPNVTELLDPLYEATKGTTKGPVEFNEEQRNCFHKLREAIVSTPAIGLPNYKQPFNLFRHEQNGKAHWSANTGTWRETATLGILLPETGLSDMWVTFLCKSSSSGGNIKRQSARHSPGSPTRHTGTTCSHRNPSPSTGMSPISSKTNQVRSSPTQSK